MYYQMLPFLWAECPIFILPMYDVRTATMAQDVFVYITVLLSNPVIS
jgi:hypothetical protein